VGRLCTWGRLGSRWYAASYPFWIGFSFHLEWIAPGLSVPDPSWGVGCTPGLVHRAVGAGGLGHLHPGGLEAPWWQREYLMAPVLALPWGPLRIPPPERVAFLGLWRAQLSLLGRRGGWGWLSPVSDDQDFTVLHRVVVGRWGTWSLVWRLLIPRCPVGSQESCPSVHQLQDPSLGHSAGWRS